MCTFVYLLVCLCIMYMWYPWRLKRMSDSSRPDLTDGLIFQMWVLGTELWSFARAISLLSSEPSLQPF